jgi:hypothetical protein
MDKYFEKVRFFKNCHAHVRRKDQMMKIVLILTMVVTLAAGCATFPSARTNTCINNMRILDSATRQTAMERNLKNGDQAPRDEVSAYIKNGIGSRQCPEGGVYESGVVGTDPQCSIHGTLTAARERKPGIR